MLPGFYSPLRGRKPRSAQQVFADELAALRRKSFKQIGEIFNRFIPGKYLKPELSGDMSRRSIFSKENTFWAFLVNKGGQVFRCSKKSLCRIKATILETRLLSVSWFSILRTTLLTVLYLMLPNSLPIFSKDYSILKGLIIPSCVSHKRP
jgi:hypothetical protein